MRKIGILCAGIINAGTVGGMDKSIELFDTVISIHTRACLKKIAL